MSNRDCDARAEAAVNLMEFCHHQAKAMGWWDEYFTMPEQYQKYWVASKLMLITSEVSEAMEGHRKGINDDHLPDRPMLEVELADAAIRIFDLAGGLGLDLGGAIAAKLDYNRTRADHQKENRQAAGGKSI